MKVIATDKYQKLNIEDKELKRIPNEGEELTISGERYEILNGKNEYNEVFVKAVENVREPVEKVTKKRQTKKDKE